MDENSIFGHDTNFDPTARQQLIKSSVPVLVKESFDLDGDFVPAPLKGCLTDVLGYSDVGSVEFAVADNADVRDICDFLPNKFEDRATKVAGDTLIRLGALEPVREKRMVEPLAAGGESDDLGHT
jgi:hypothetical protein